MNLSAELAFLIVTVDIQLAADARNRRNVENVPEKNFGRLVASKLKKEPMELRITTESGSIYFLNKNAMTWDRILASPHSDPTSPVRTRGGPLLEWPQVVVGQPVDIMGPPIQTGATFRLVRTSPVTKVEEISSN